MQPTKKSLNRFRDGHQKRLFILIGCTTNIAQFSRKQKFFFGQSKKKTEFLKNRTGDEPHPGRARSARRTAKTLAIFANRRTKNRNNFGKFDNGASRGIRTPDRWLKRPLLYQLSYGRKTIIFLSNFYKFSALVTF